ncbi:MAG: DUF4929 domain-containing protein [Paraprevotella sp.]|nr:DUF4929 domain-containing protein [Paraprevotella sp.]
MKKYFAYATILLAACFVSACNEDEEPATYTGKNGVTLNILNGNGTLIEDEDDAVTVSVTLDRPYDTDINLTVNVQGPEPEHLLITPNPVTVKAGSKSTTFQVVSAQLGNLAEQHQYTLNMTNLQSDMEIIQTVNITLRTRTGMDDLTHEQKALVESWKTNYGIDVTPWIGKISLTGNVTEPGDGYTADFTEPKETTLQGASIITLGEGCTEDKIVLKMVDNPMGLTAFLYDWFRKNTVEDFEYYANEEWGTGLETMEKINWNKDSQEIFNVTLDGIEIDLTQATDNGYAIHFTKEGTAYVYDVNGNPLLYALEDEEPEPWFYSKECWIPFKYEFSAWTRLLTMVAEGDEEALEMAIGLSTADPEYFLLFSSVNEDGYDSEENNYYVEPRGSIDFTNGTMTFEFPADHQLAGGYARVNVTYTAN